MFRNVSALLLEVCFEFLTLENQENKSLIDEQTWANNNKISHVFSGEHWGKTAKSQTLLQYYYFCISVKTIGFIQTMF